MASSQSTPATIAGVSSGALKLSSNIPPPSLAPSPVPPSTEPEIVSIPSYSSWFSWDHIDDCEIRSLPEFLSNPTSSKNPKTYLYIRNSIIGKHRERPSRKLTFTEARKTVVGDVGAIRRVFDFLENWGLVNYNGVVLKQSQKLEEKESKVAAGQGGENAGGTGDTFSTKRWCSGCKTLCSISCFASDKYNLTLCARCYVKGNYRTGITNSDFRRVEISEDTKSNWSEKETLHLLEAIFHYGDDWKRVAEHVGGGRTGKDCVARLVKLPFGQELVRRPDADGVDDVADAELCSDCIDTSRPAKRMHLMPLADATNPVMAQAAFLSALAGSNVAESAARAALTALSEGNHTSVKRIGDSLSNNVTHKVADTISVGDRTSVIEKEQKELENAILSITDVQMKQIQEKIEEFEEFDLHMEKERQRLQQMKELLFADQLSLKFHKTAGPSVPPQIIKFKPMAPKVTGELTVLK